MTDDRGHRLRRVRWLASVAVVALAAAGSTRLHVAVADGAATVGHLSEAGRQTSGLRYDTEYPAIGYSTTAPSDRIANLQASLARGDVRLAHGGHRGYLDALLLALDIDVSSQLLVFSRTSLQVGRIHPDTPRAIYFNDDTYVAWVQDANALEIASMDPTLGPVFYTLDQRQAVAGGFERHRSQCLQCHDSYSLTGGGVPRFITGSGYTNTVGDLVSHEGWILTSDRTPLRSRWGGWYVSGRHGDQVHLGNIVVRDAAELQRLDSLRRGNLDDLASVLDARAYPRNTSDIVALMVLEHQVRVQNAIVRVNFDTRMARYQAEHGDAMAASADRIASIAEPLVDALFLTGEARLTDRIAGTSGFAAGFEARGPRDSQGRSLRTLDLRDRLFTYPLSFLIYSPAFDTLPDEGRRQVYRRIAEVLRGEDDTGKFTRLTASDRAAIAEILRETKPEFAAAAGSERRPQ